MSLPLKDCNFIEKESSKPGHLKDRYYKAQDINNAIDEVKQELGKNSSILINTEAIFKIIDKWFNVEKYKQSFSGIKTEDKNAGM